MARSQVIANQGELLKGRASVQRDLAELEKWACRNLMKFKKANTKSCPWGE